MLSPLTRTTHNSWQRHPERILEHRVRLKLSPAPQRPGQTTWEGHEEQLHTYHTAAPQATAAPCWGSLGRQFLQGNSVQGKQPAASVLSHFLGAPLQSHPTGMWKLTTQNPSGKKGKGPCNHQLGDFGTLSSYLRAQVVVLSINIYIMTFWSMTDHI